MAEVVGTEGNTSEGDLMTHIGERVSEGKE